MNNDRPPDKETFLSAIFGGLFYIESSLQKEQDVL